ncbi:MAG: protein O-mannosyl-transferase family [Fidelibacterota bacterium]
MIHSDYIRVNRIIAGVILVVTFLIYFLTTADTVPYWDCGEFIACSYILGIPHPPGSPLYLIIGRLFSLLLVNQDIAFRINLISPIVSALAVMFLYLSMVKIISHWRGAIKDQLDVIISFGGAVVGSLAFAFTDSHWFNAVEAEVYSVSTFFTAIVIWLIMLWSERAEEPGNERYFLIIAYMIGLATGVHLLNLLTLPFVALIIYFRKFKFQWRTFLITVLITYAVYAIINHGIIDGLPKLVDWIGLSGTMFLILVIFGGMMAAIIIKHRLLSVALTAVVLILIGYSSYALIFIRSAQDPRIDENDPETVPRAISYMEREQYGQMFQLPRRFDGLPAKHEVVGRPEKGRQYSAQQERKYKYYRMDKQWSFFWNYQVKKMYWRYFLWQFAGRGPSTDSWVSAYGANPREDGVDWFQFGLPLAFFLGIFGMVFHFQKDRTEAFSILTLFLMTGLAIIVFVNQDNPQPRERDYSYVGSFLAFSIWIGVAAAALMDFLRSKLKNKTHVKKGAIGLLVLQLIFIPGVMLKANYHEHNRTGNKIAWDYSYNLLQSCEPNAILFTNGDNDTFPLWYLQEVEKVRLDVTVANLSLLNTDWYIRQLRDSRREGSADSLGRELERFINLTDDQIRSVASGLLPWKAQKVQIPAENDPENKDGYIEWMVQPTYANAALMVKDMMILRIINDAKWKYPVYFAVTVPSSNRLGLEPYLEMEGLVYRVLSHPVDRRNPINPDRMWQNLMTEFGSETWNRNFTAAQWESNEGEIWSRQYKPGYLFRNLGLKEVYYFPRTNVRLLQNIRSAYMQLAAYYFLKFRDLQAQGLENSEEAIQLKEKVLQVMERMEDNIPESTIKFDSKDLYYQVGRIYGELGQLDRLKAIMDKLMARGDLTLRDKLEYGQVYVSNLDSFEIGKEIFEKLYFTYLDLERAVNTNKKVDPRVWNEWQQYHSKIVSSLVFTYRKMGLKDDAEDVLSEWLDKNPNDPVGQKLLEELKNEKQSDIEQE